MSEPARIHPADLERLAGLVADRLAARLLSAPEAVSLGARPSASVATPETLQEAAPGLLDAKEVAARFGVTPGWVRENADRLGVIRLGDGPKPRLRFDLETVAAALTPSGRDERSEPAASPAPTGPARPRKDTNSIELSWTLPSRHRRKSRTSTSGASAAGTASPLATRSEPSPRAERSPRGGGSRAAGRAPRVVTERSRDGR